MEEDILKIIEQNRLKIIEWDGSTSVSFIHPDHYPKLAKEITSHVMNWVRWYFKEGQFTHRFMNEEESYQHWFKNILK